MPNSHILEMLNELKGLREDLKILLAPKVPLALTPEAPSIPEPEKQYFPVPSEFEEEKNKVLNQDFKLEINYPGDGRPVFEFMVIVPEKYSNMTPDQKTANKGVDRRLKVIDNALGLNGVKAWLEMVYKNLNAETQARISADRYL